MEQVAVLLHELRRDSFRLSREMREAIFSGDFGQRRLKPMLLEAVIPDRTFADPVLWLSRIVRSTHISIAVVVFLFLNCVPPSTLQGCWKTYLC